MRCSCSISRTAPPLQEQHSTFTQYSSERAFYTSKMETEPQTCLHCLLDDQEISSGYSGLKSEAQYRSIIRNRSTKSAFGCVHTTIGREIDFSGTPFRERQSNESNAAFRSRKIEILGLSKECLCFDTRRTEM